MPWRQVEPVIDPDVRKLCVSRYPGHPRGCPNHGKKKGCPPSSPMLGEVLDLSRPVFAVWNAFNLAVHVERMQRKHPDWSRRQLVCCLYWQGTARKRLAYEVVSLIAEDLRVLKTMKVVECPEACGVNVTETMHQIGIELEWPPVNLAYQVVLAGTVVKEE